MTQRDTIIGRPIFEVFPDNPAEPDATGVRNLRASLQRVLTSRVPDAMAVQKYDIRRPDSETDAFEERYWSPVNSPVFRSNGELAWIIHRVEDVTEFVRSKQQMSDEHQTAQEFRSRAEQMESEIYLRAQELQRVNEELRKVNQELVRLYEVAKAAELAARDSEEFVRLIIESAQEAFIVSDALGTITNWNKEAERTFGWSREEVLGQRLADTIIPRRYCEAHHQGLQHLLETGNGPILNKRIELFALHRDGHEFPIEITVGSLQRSGKWLFYAFLHDISERKKAEAALSASELRFRLLVESVSDYAIFLLDPHGNVASWNAGAERIKGYCADEIIGRHFSCFYPPEIAANGWPEQELQHAVKDGRFEDEGWRVRKDGSEFWANVVFTALWDEAGNLKGFSKVTRDLTERKRTEETLQKAHDDLERRVVERTAALNEANRTLQMEIFECRQLEIELRQAQRTLPSRTPSCLRAIKSYMISPTWRRMI